MNRDINELNERLELCRKKSIDLDIKIKHLAGQSIKYWVSLWHPGIGEVKAELLAHPPVSIRSEIGMIVNEQRSILDALACNLAIENGANDISDVSFPIVKSKAAFSQREARKRISKLSQENQSKIESFKPWKPSDDKPDDGNLALFMLHEGDRIRKHRNLLKWACLGGVFPGGNGKIGMMQSSPVIFKDMYERVSGELGSHSLIA